MKMLFSEFTYLHDCFEAHEEGSSRWIFEAMLSLASPPKQPDASCFLEPSVTTYNMVPPMWSPAHQLFHSKLFRLSHYTVTRHQTHSNSQQHSRLITTKHSYAEALKKLWAKKKTQETLTLNIVKGTVLQGSMTPSPPQCSGDGLGLEPVGLGSGLGQWAWGYLLR